MIVMIFGQKFGTRGSYSSHFPYFMHSLHEAWIKCQRFNVSYKVVPGKKGEPICPTCAPDISDFFCRVLSCDICDSWVPDSVLRCITWLGGGVATPLKKISVRQLGWSFPLYGNIIQWCSSHHQPDEICCIECGYSCVFWRWMKMVEDGWRLVRW